MRKLLVNSGKVSSFQPMKSSINPDALVSTGWNNLFSSKPSFIYNDPLLFSLRALCLLEMRPLNPNQIVAESSLALALNPDDLSARLARSKGYEGLGDLESASADLQRVLQVSLFHRGRKNVWRRWASLVLTCPYPSGESQP